LYLTWRYFARLRANVKTKYKGQGERVKNREQKKNKEGAEPPAPEPPRASGPPGSPATPNAGGAPPQRPQDPLITRLRGEGPAESPATLSPPSTLRRSAPSRLDFIVNYDIKSEWDWVLRCGVRGGIRIVSMAIHQIVISDFLVFSGKFAVDFSPGINVIIGANATGKTTLIKVMYAVYKEIYKYCGPEYPPDKKYGKIDFGSFFSNTKNNELTKKIISSFGISASENLLERSVGNILHEYHINEMVRVHCGKEIEFRCYPAESGTYIPEKDMLSNSKGLPETVEYGKLQFNQCDVDIIKKARVAPNKPKQALVEKIEEIIGGEIENDGENFFIKKPNIEKPVPFAFEASGYRKFALLATLIRNEQIKSGGVLFWDEPENSLNPELMPVLVDILLELQRKGVQIFIATHNHILARYFDLKRTTGDAVMFHNLYNDGGRILCNSIADYTKLKPGVLEAADEALFKTVVAKAMGIKGGD
jgi:AAA15 family ATPase/GTPase